MDTIEGGLTAKQVFDAMAAAGIDVTAIQTVRNNLELLAHNINTGQTTEVAAVPKPSPENLTTEAVRDQLQSPERESLMPGPMIADSTAAAGPTFGQSTVAEVDPALKPQPAPASAEAQALLAQIGELRSRVERTETFMKNLAAGIQNLPDTLGVAPFAERLAWLENKVFESTGANHPNAQLGKR